MTYDVGKINECLPEWAINSILDGYRGSHCHGTYIPNSDPNSVDDIDIFRIVVQPALYYLGIEGYYKKYDHYEAFIDEYDILIIFVTKITTCLRRLCHQSTQENDAL